jgi:CO/xanthine dehydrogenase Mo-binding subunit
MRDGRWLIGWGMATANYPMFFAPASAQARLLPDGTAEVTSAASDTSTTPRAALPHGNTAPLEKSNELWHQKQGGCERARRI